MVGLFVYWLLSYRSTSLMQYLDMEMKAIIIERKNKVYVCCFRSIHSLSIFTCLFRVPSLVRREPLGLSGSPVHHRKNMYAQTDTEGQFRLTYHWCLWTVGESLSTWREPTNAQGEHANGWSVLTKETATETARAWDQIIKPLITRRTPNPWVIVSPLTG